MNIRYFAALLLANSKLEELERTLKRRNDWRTARKVSDVRDALADAIAGEQEGLGAMVAEFQEAQFAEETARQ